MKKIQKLGRVAKAFPLRKRVKSKERLVSHFVTKSTRRIFDEGLNLLAYIGDKKKANEIKDDFIAITKEFKELGVEEMRKTFPLIRRLLLLVLKIALEFDKNSDNTLIPFEFYQYVQTLDKKLMKGMLKGVFIE